MLVHSLKPDGEANCITIESTLKVLITLSIKTQIILERYIVLVWNFNFDMLYSLTLVWNTKADTT